MAKAGSRQDHLESRILIVKPFEKTFKLSHDKTAKLKESLAWNPPEKALVLSEKSQIQHWIAASQVCPSEP